MTPEDREKTAFEFAAETTKQLIGLATGIVAVEVTFSKDLPEAARGWALASWIVLSLSAGLGIWTLMALTGNLAAGKSDGPVSVMTPNVRIPSALQVLVFLLGFVLTVVFGGIAVWNVKSG